MTPPRTGEGLLPCPFCGSAAKMITARSEGVTYFEATCPVCGASACAFRALSMEEAARPWNRRSLPAPPTPDRERVRVEARLCEECRRQKCEPVPEPHTCCACCGGSLTTPTTSKEPRG